MSFIRILHTLLRALSPAFLAPRSSACPAEQLSTRGEPTAEAGESHYRASRERALVQALYDGSMR